MLETLIGIAGMLGIGWTYAGSRRRGLLFMVSWWAILALAVTALVIAKQAWGVVGILGILPFAMTLGVGIPVFSGFRVRRSVQSFYKQASSLNATEGENQCSEPLCY